MQRVITLWKIYAREFLGTTQILPNKVCIYFNTWYASPAYRKEIAHKLGITFTDAGYTEVSALGGGSSFDGITHQQMGDKMQVLDRSSSLLASEKSLLQEILNFPDILSLHRSITDHMALSSIRENA